MADDRIQRITMPKWGLSMRTGRITEWLVVEGEEVAKGDELVDIDTDKIVGSLESTATGRIRRVLAEAGQDLPIGATLALVAPADVPDEEIEAAAAAARAEWESGELEGEAGPEPAVVEVGGRLISYLTLGPDDTQTPVVLVHGFGGDKNSWLFVQEPLAEARQVHALDLPGHGASGKDVGDGSLALLAGTVVGFLDALGIERAHLVGHSLGGAVVAAVAQQAPARVESLTLLAPAGFGGRPNAAYLRGFATASSRRELKPLLGDLFADPALVTRQLVDDLLRYKRLDGVPAALGTLLDTMLTPDDQQAFDTPGMLAEVTAPVTVLWGSADRILPPPDGVELVDAGHMLHMEAANTIVARLRSRLG